jgi:ABC-type phosphate transport system ATPase subunit
MTTKELLSSKPFEDTQVVHSQSDIETLRENVGETNYTVVPESIRNIVYSGLPEKSYSRRKTSKERLEEFKEKHYNRLTGEMADELDDILRRM